MKNIKAIIKFELIRYFLSPLAYVYLVGFLILSGSLAIYFGHFFMDGNANLWGLFDYQPWVYLLFIPGISMRVWAEEFHSKSIVQTLTIPISITNLVWGKFFASWLFAVIAILLTFPFWITVNVLGSPDNGVIIISYLGCFILAGAMLAISQTMSALTKNPIIALVLAVFVNLLFFWSGFEYVLFWARSLFSDVIVDAIISFSFLAHFSSLSRGLVELRDIIFFGSLIIFFNLLTIIIISLRTKGTAGLISSSSIKHSITVVVLLFLGFFSLNIIANNLFRQISYDFTEEKYLSLTKNTKDILRKIENPIIARLYYSPILEKRNPQIRQTYEQVKLLLKQYKAYSRGKFDYRIYNPQFLDKTEDKALADGLQPIPLIDINQNALFGISFSNSLTQKETIPFLSLDRIPFLEQELTSSIYKMQHKKKTLGLMSSLPVMGGRLSDMTLKKWEIFNLIEQFYDVHLISEPEDLDIEYDVFMLIHPRQLESSVAEKIKKQKKVLLLLDVFDDAARLYSPEGSTGKSSALFELADYWGIDFYNGNVAADFDNSITVDETVNYKSNPSFTQDLLQFKVTKNDLSQNHRVTHKLDNILFSSASMVMPKKDANILYFPLIETSTTSALMDVELAQKSATPREILEKFSPQDYAIFIAAEFLSNNPARPFDIIAVADTDFMYDNFWAKEQHFLDSSYFTPIFDNANFVLNALDYLTENDDLISLRGKSMKHRSLYKIDNMRKKNIYRYKLKENDIFNAMNGAKSVLREIVAKKNFEERASFSSDELAVIGKTRQEINNLRQSLSNLKTKSNDNIADLEIKVKFFNIYFVSLIVILLALILHLRKKNWKSFTLKNIFVIDKQIFKLSLWIILIIALAGVSVYYDNKNTISEYEDIPVFKDFNKTIEQTKIIRLKNSKQTLTFVLKDNIWILEEYPALPVYQERIRSFLVSLHNMTYYEKKSNKAEDLKYFGFSSLKDNQSPTIEISLMDSENKVLEQLDVGWFNLDLGRGAKAAYVKFSNQFQVWLVDVDFYDLSLDKNAWTYSTLWNLRFGRFIQYNKIDNDIKVMTLVKDLLNTEIISVQQNVSAKKAFSINIDVENNNEFELEFYSTEDQKYFVKFYFIKMPNGKHLEFFENAINGKYLEISKSNWEKIQNDIK
ncbi:MAG: Gldg family protein [Acetobacter sp.]|nr:Gldg family protein [Acetobacter sp.]